MNRPLPKALKKDSPSAPKPVVLLIEDEKPIRRFVKPYLESLNFKVIEAKNGKEGLALASSGKPEVILLDLCLPDMDGLEVLGQLRQWTQVPVIILTARDKDKEKVKGLDAGADDYLIKPFDVTELAARIRVALRHLALTKPQAEEPAFQTGDLKMDWAAHIVTVRGKEVHLTPNEYDILAFLAKHVGNPVTHKMIVEAIWGRYQSDQDVSLRIHIHNLREKIEEDVLQPEYILTEPGVGYRLKGR
jgi:two-component system, OmpR family, KDP operon response regulator KdpE